MEATKPYKFIGFVAVKATNLTFTWFGPWMPPNPINLYGLGLDSPGGSLKRPVWREMSSRRTGFHRISVSVDSKGLRLVVVVFRCDLAAASHCRQNTANHYKTKRQKPLLCKTFIDLYDSGPWRPPNRISL